MKILVTGATGYVGNRLVKELLGCFPEAEISALILPDDSFKRMVSVHEEVRIIEGNIVDREDVFRAVKGQTHVVHLAAFISYWKRDKKKLMLVNKTGVKNIVDACIENDILKLLHISTAVTFGFRKDGIPSNENTPYNWPGSFNYMVSKYRGEKIVERAVKECGLRAVILNPSAIMGPGDYNIQTSQNKLLDLIYNRILVGCFSGGLGLVDVRDVVSIIIKALASDEIGEKYLLVGANVEYKKVVKTIAQYTKKRIYPFLIPRWILSSTGKFLEAVSDITRKRPPLTHAVGKMSGWKVYYSNDKSKKYFDHEFIPFEKMLADSCRYFEEMFLE